MKLNKFWRKFRKFVRQKLDGGSSSVPAYARGRSHGREPVIRFGSDSPGSRKMRSASRKARAAAVKRKKTKRKKK